MPQQHNPQPEADLEALYYLESDPQPERQSRHDRLALPDPEQKPDYEVEFHPDDIQDLVTWEKRSTESVALWLILMMVITLVLVPYAPFFTPVVTLFFLTMSVLFYIRSRLIHVNNVLRDIVFYMQYPYLQWFTGGFTLAVSSLVYFFAVIVPYSAVPASVQSLSFLVAMNFAMYTPISIMRVIRQRTLRRKRHPNN